MLFGCRRSLNRWICILTLFLFLNFFLRACLSALADEALKNKTRSGEHVQSAA